MNTKKSYTKEQVADFISQWVSEDKENRRAIACLSDFNDKEDTVFSLHCEPIAIAEYITMMMCDSDNSEDRRFLLMALTLETILNCAEKKLNERQFKSLRDYILSYLSDDGQEQPKSHD